MRQHYLSKLISNERDIFHPAPMNDSVSFCCVITHVGVISVKTKVSVGKREREG